MNSITVNGQQTTPSSPDANQCVVCGAPMEARCFCKISRQDGQTVPLCCPDCVVQYIDLGHPTLDNREAELRAYENRLQFFVGDNKPWS